MTVCKENQNSEPLNQLAVEVSHLTVFASLKAELSVGVVNSGKGVTQYNRMGKHKFERDEE